MTSLIKYYNLFRKKKFYNGKTKREQKKKKNSENLFKFMIQFINNLYKLLTNKWIL